MRKTLFLRLVTGCSYPASWVVTDGGVEGPSMIKDGTLEEAAAAGVGARVVLLAPSDLMLLAGVSVPATQRRRIQTAVPYALEDQLAVDVDTLHFAIGSRDELGMVSTATVTHTVMERWLADLAAVGLQPAVMFPDVLAVPWAPDSWSLLIEDQGALLRTGPQAGMAIDRENVDAMLGILVSQIGESKPPLIRIYDARVHDATPLLLNVGIEVDVELLQEPVIALLSRSLDESVALDLLQGDYSKREKVTKLLRPWRATAALLAMVIVVQLIDAGVEYKRLSRASQDLRQQARTVYQQAFPEARKVNDDPRPQMEQKLLELKSAGNVTGNGGFVGLLASVGEPLAQTPKLNLDRLNYRAGEMNVSFTIGDLQQLDELKQKLAKESGLPIEIQSATARDGQVEARLQIGKSGGA